MTENFPPPRSTESVLRTEAISERITDVIFEAGVLDAEERKTISDLLAACSDFLVKADAPERTQKLLDERKQYLSKRIWFMGEGV